jgi:hypothetical protein
MKDEEVAMIPLRLETRLIFPLTHPAAKNLLDIEWRVLQ